METPTLVPSGGVEAYLSSFHTSYQDVRGKTWPLSLPTSPEFALKKLWPQDRIKNLAYKDHPFFAMVQKNEDFYGESMYIVLQDRRPAGRSATFSTAKTISETTNGSPGGCRFLLERAKDYAVFGLDTESMLAASRDSGSLIRGYERTMQGAVEGLSASLASALVRGKYGVKGQISAIAREDDYFGAGFDSIKLTLTNAEDVVNFEVGMSIGLTQSATTITAADMISTGTLYYAYVGSVDRDAGIVRLKTADYDAVTSLANYYCFEEGDGGTTTYKSTGLADWLPATAPTSSSADFLSVIRSVDPVRRAGARIDISSLNPEEGLATAPTKMAVHNAAPKMLFVNPTDFLNIIISLGSKVETEYMSVATINFESVKVRGPRGVVSVVADADVPKATAYLLDMSTWTFHSMGAAPQILDQDGAILHRAETSDLWQGRMVYFGNLACDAPGHNARLTMPS